MMGKQLQVTGQFNYLGPMTEHPVFHTEDQSKSNLVLDPHVMPVMDIRELAAPNLEREGFMNLPLRLDLGEVRDVRVIEAEYSPRLLEAVRDLTKAPRIFLTPPLLRFSEKIPRPGMVNSIPARYPHCDYDRENFHSLMRSLVENEPDRDRWLAGRYAAINTWRVLTPPPQDLPLAIVDRSTLSADDMFPTTVIIDDGKQAVHYTQSVPRFNPAHRWYYISDMTLDDTLVFLGFDSVSDQLPGAPHSAFDFGALVDHAIPRQSCEIRAFVFWGE